MSAGKTFIIRRGQTAVPNATIYGTFEGIKDANGDPDRLTIQSLGLLLLLLSRPQGRASMGYRALMGRGLGRDGLLKAKRQLKDAGLVHEYKRRTAGGSVVTDTVVAEVSITEDEARQEWLAMLGDDAPKPKEKPTSDRAPENGATGENEGSTVRRITGARSTGASLPRGSAKVSKETSSQETEEIKKPDNDQPSPGTDTGSNDATSGDGHAAVLERLAERRRLKSLRTKGKSLRSGLDESGSGAAPLPGSPVAVDSYDCSCGWTTAWTKGDAAAAGKAWDAISRHQWAEHNDDAQEAQA